jgi:hypothetical protein
MSAWDPISLRSASLRSDTSEGATGVAKLFGWANPIATIARAVECDATKIRDNCGECATIFQGCNCLGIGDQLFVDAGKEVRPSRSIMERTNLRISCSTHFVCQRRPYLLEAHSDSCRAARPGRSGAAAIEVLQRRSVQFIRPHRNVFKM